MQMKLQKINSSSRVIMGYIGVCMLIVGVALLLNLLTLIAFPEESDYAKCFLVPGVISIIIGAGLFLPIYKKDKVDLERNQDYIIVFLAWMIVILICAVPYLMTGEYTFTESFFESTSGLTTSGFTIVDVDNAPKIILMFRGLTLYIGGIGMILIMTALFSTTFGMRLYNAEGHPNKLIPNLIKSARLIICIYTGYIIVGAIMYVFAGMSFFDAINHAIAAVANGGFSTRSQSIGYYNSPIIEMITIILTLIGATNFLLNLMLIKGKFKEFFEHCETKLVIAIWIIFVPILAFVLCFTVCTTLGDGFRVALFYIASAMMGSGFQISASFANWPIAGIGILILVMIIGGQSGSTAAGVKAYRVAISLKAIWYDLRTKLAKKNEVLAEKINFYGKDEVLTKDRVLEAHNFIVLYIVILCLGTFIFMLYGYPLHIALFDFVSSLGCNGLTLGVVGRGASEVVNWVAIVGMIMGRLDIYPMIIALLVLSNDVKAVTRKFVKKGRKSNV